MEGVCVAFFLPSFTLVIFERGAKIPEGKDSTVISVGATDSISNAGQMLTVANTGSVSTYPTWRLPAESVQSSCQD